MGVYTYQPLTVMHKPKEGIKIKVLLSYFFLVAIASFSIWFIFSKTRYLTENQDRIGLLNTKMLHFNAVLTNMYQAEALERSYVQTGNPLYLRNYEVLMDQIIIEIDSMSSFSVNPIEKLHTDSILNLLTDKRQNLKALVAFKKGGTTDDIYIKALGQLFAQKAESDSLIKVERNISDSTDTTFIYHKKRNFFKRLADAFSSGEKLDSSILISTVKAIHTDSVYSKYDPSDSVRKILEDAIFQIRHEDLLYEKQLSIREKRALARDHIITIQLRQILSLIEKDILLNSIQEFRLMQSNIRETTWYLAIMGFIALSVIILFLILILKDISRSRRYRTQLEEAKEYSESLLKSKEQFMLSITHDIKTPVATLIGYAQLMHQTNDKEQKGIYMNRINNSAEHILKLINDLVDLSKLETGKLTIEPQPFILGEMVQDIYQSFYPLARAKGLDFIIENTIPPEKQIYADHVRILQILGNMLSNAIKYTYNGCVNFRVSGSFSQDSVPDHLEFEISDTGIGIEKQYQNEIFNEFTRFSGLSDDRQNEGAGLGLAIAKRLTTLLGGKIALESTPGAGSKFTVVLPVQTFETELTASKSEIMQPDQIPLFKKRAKVLIIDDDRAYLEMLEKALRTAGLEIIAVDQPVEALKILQRLHFDLIITDVRMPVLQGTDLLAYIQKKTGKHIPVIALSGSDSFHPGDFPEITIGGILMKPVQINDLLQMISRILQLEFSTGIPDPNLPQTNDTAKKEYNLSQINRFAVNDPVGIHQILTSFIEISYEHMEHFQGYLIQNDRKSLSDLAHKMLAMFRQLEADNVVESLIQIERNSDRSMNDKQWRELGMTTLDKIEQLIGQISEEQHIYIRM